MKLRTSLLGAASTLAMIGFVGSASAADLPVKGYAAPAPIPVASWQGAYIGASIGVGRYDTNMQFFTEAGVCGDTMGTTCHTSASGVLGGFQIGYNWQASRYWVYGVEADWNWTDFDRSISDSSGFFTTAKMDWISTFRGRMGLAVDNTMVYFTGGLALADIKSGWGGPNYQADDGRRTRVGWVAGLGVEHQFNPQWSIKGEVLYHDFGNEDRSHFEPYNSGTYTTNYTHTVTTAKIGLNYKLPW